MEKHLCAVLTPEKESECIPVVEDVKKEANETRENEAGPRAANLQRALERKGQELQRALRRALSGRSDGVDLLLAGLQGLEEEGVPELAEREKGVPLGSPEDLVHVGQNFAKHSGGQAANLRLADMLRAVAAVVKAPAARDAKRKVRNGQHWKTDGLPSGVQCLKEALDTDLGTEEQYSQTKLGRMLIHLKVGGGYPVAGDVKESEQVGAAWLAAVQGAITLRGGCKPAVVRASFEVSAKTKAQAPLHLFVGKDAPEAVGHGERIGFRSVLHAVDLGTLDQECEKWKDLEKEEREEEKREEEKREEEKRGREAAGAMLALEDRAPGAAEAGSEEMREEARPDSPPPLASPAAETPPRASPAAKRPREGAAPAPRREAYRTRPGIGLAPGMPFGGWPEPDPGRARARDPNMAMPTAAQPGCAKICNTYSTWSPY